MKCEQIRDRIKKARRAQGYTQEYMAESLKISTNSYREIESGTTTLINPRLYKIAEILDISLESLIFDHFTQDKYIETLKKIEKECRIKVKNITMSHKIEIAEKEGQITILKAHLETKERIIGVLNEREEEY